VGAADLGDRVVAVAHEHPLVEPGSALALVTVEGAAALGYVSGELLQVEAADRARIAGVAREQRPLDRLRQVDQREHGPVEVGEVWCEEATLLLVEVLDRIAHGRAIVVLGADASVPQPRTASAASATRTAIAVDHATA
jgi:hypothetical protein